MRLPAPRVLALLLAAAASAALPDVQDCDDSDENYGHGRGVCRDHKSGELHCCEGWEAALAPDAPDAPEAAGGPLCQPVCRRQCVFGTCVSPDCCRCLPGYGRRTASDPDAPCKPLCSRPCINADCTAPDVCTCRRGFAPTNSQNECKPAGGVQLAHAPPDDCSEGYEPQWVKGAGVDGAWECAPVCPGGCVSGRCAAPGVCAPLCDPPCGPHATCAPPGRCDCHQGYAVTADARAPNASASAAVCGPVCVSDCPNGRCVAPGRCECLPGFELLTSEYEEGEEEEPAEEGESEGKCVPRCDPPCGDHGDCDRPGVCTCARGFAQITGRGCEPIQKSTTTSTAAALKKIAKESIVESTSAAPTTPPPSEHECAAGCVHGSCGEDGLCRCADGWLGADCGEEDKRGCRRCHPEATRGCNGTGEGDGGGGAHCVCVEGWGDDDCSRPCALLSGGPFFDASDCPELEGCYCPDVHNHFCRPGADVACGSEALAARRRQEAPPEEAPGENWLQAGTVWWPVAGAAAVLLLVVVAPSAWALHRRERVRRSMVEAEENIPMRGSYECPAVCRSHSGNDDSWRFMPG